MKKLVLLLAFFAFGLLSLMAQTKEITGTVTSADDGSSIPGVSVSVQGTTLGTITDIDGKYRISVPQNATTLVFSFVGMETQQVAISGSVINVTLSPDLVGLDEVLVVAYGTATRESFTGAAAVVDASTLEKRQVSNVTQALTGVTAGVQAASNTGQPGTSAKIRIRGVGSLSASSAPLYVVDGIPYGEDISSISTQDIQSVTVLKDAASAALYGARGANGVILITTKKGKKGKVSVNLDVKAGINQRSVPEYDIMTDPAMYYEKYYEGIYNNQIAAGLSPSDANVQANQLMFGNQGLEYNIYTVPDGQNLIDQNGKINPNATLGRVWDNDYYLINDNWYNELFGKTNTRKEVNLSVSGGNDKQTTFFSLNYLNDEGIISNSGFERITARINTDYQLNDWIKVGGNISYSNSVSRSPSDQSGLSSKNLFYVSRIVAPIYPLYVRGADKQIIVDDLGHTLYDYGTGEYPGLTRPIMSIANPASDLRLDKQQYNVDLIGIKGFANFNLMEGLKFALNVGYDVDNTRYLDKGNAYYGQSADFGGNIYKRNTHISALTLQELLTYKKSINQHSFDILVGHETYDRQWERMYGIKYNLFDPESEELSNAILRQETGSTGIGYFVQGYFSRLQYDYAQKYYLSASYRRDASSRFTPDNRWGNFWSVGGSWLMEKEGFLAGADWLDMLKYKISYGAQGNDALLYENPANYYDGGQNYYPAQDQFNIKNSNDDFAIELDYKGNKDITWETSYNLNTGFEFSLFNGTFSGSVEYFNRRVENMLYYIPVPPTVGYSSYPDNIGSMRNRGIDVDLHARLIHTPKFTWSVYVNGTHYKNEILSLPPQFSDPDGYINGRRILRVGGSIYDFWYPVYAGVNQETGAPQWRITNDDGTYGVTEDYSTASLKKNSDSPGTSLPDLQGGFGTSVDAFGFDFSVSCTYGLGGLTYDYIYQQLMHGGQASEAGTNWHKDILNSWTASNTNTDVPMVNFGGKDIGATSDRFLISSSYLSINNVTLGYTLPKKVLNKIDLEAVRLYFAADNVYLFSKRKGLDPRQNFSGSTDFIYSPIRTISVGANIKF
ncbi:SusC/RagA family TonB-linked outer membrane protein [Prolixibacter bellariivorans]|nr:SusC/RagA family TonB-linked outer membrane protein [Prolixibacter bellariivorans]